MQIEDHRALRAREATGDQRERRLLRSLRDDGVGLEPPKLARDPPGEPQVVERAVEHPDRGGTREDESRIGRGLPVERGAELTPVELGGERVEAALERAPEREAKAASADQ